MVYSHSFTGNAVNMSEDLLYSRTEPADAKYLFVFIMLETVAIAVPSSVFTATNCPLFTPDSTLITKENPDTDGPSSVVITVPSFKVMKKSQVSGILESTIIFIHDTLS